METLVYPPFSLHIDLNTGVMANPSNHIVRKASSMVGYYADEQALRRLIDQGDPVHYEVFERPVPEEYGHLMFCISKLQPGVIGGEFFMTKGHYHRIAETAEIYLCLRGEGLMLMKTSDGQCHHERMARNSMVYVPRNWAHRSINTGSEPLISFCVYPAEAGHNYGDIEQEGFPLRVMLRDGELRFEAR